MPIRLTAQTGWRHENLETQKEFERIGKQLSASQRSTSNITGTSGIPTGSGVEEGSGTPQALVQVLSVLKNGSYISKDIVKELNFIDTVNGYQDATLEVKLKHDIQELIKSVDFSRVDIKTIGQLDSFKLLEFLKSNGIFKVIKYNVPLENNVNIYTISNENLHRYARTSYIKEFIINGIAYEVGVRGSGTPVFLKAVDNSIYDDDSNLIYSDLAAELTWNFTKANGGFDLKSKYHAYLRF